MIKTIFIIVITILYGIEIILREKDKKELKEIKKRYGDDN